MNKRDFLKSTGAMVAGGMISRLAPAQEQPGTRENWAGNITYSTDHVHTPANVDGVREVVKSCGKLRALGSRHSFNRIADCTQNQISLQRLDQVDIDDKARAVTVSAGVKYGQLAPVIDGRGYALHNLASLPHISVAGAIATATHGSGIHNGNLATAVRGLEIVTANGDLIQLSREKNGEQFLGAVVGLGAVGVVTRVTLDLLPTYQVAQTVYQNLSFDELAHNFDAIFGAGYSVSLFTDWRHHQATRVWIKRKLQPGEKHESAGDFYGAKRATEKLHPITGHPAESCTEQMGVPGPWYERLPHFKMNFTPSSGRELQTEYLVPRGHAYQAILAVEKLRDQITPHLFVTELRTIAADNLWMSTAYERDSLAIHFTWKPEWEAVKKILPQIEAQLKPFAPRPHWAKLFTLSPALLEAQYARLSDFKALVKQHDPGGKFRNEFLETNLYATQERTGAEGGLSVNNNAGTALTGSGSAEVDARIQALGDWRGEMLARLRAVIKEADPEVVEECKWKKPSNPRGVPVWSHNGMICTGETHKSVVKMTFAKGAFLDDPAGLFNSSLEGNLRRAIDFREGDKVNEKALKALIRTAVKLNMSED